MTNATNTTKPTSSKSRLSPTTRRVILALMGAVERKAPDPADDEQVYRRFRESIDSTTMTQGQKWAAMDAWLAIPTGRQWRLDGTQDYLDEQKRTRPKREAVNELRNATSHFRKVQADHESAQARFQSAVRQALLTESDVDDVAELSGLTVEEVREIRDADENSDE